MLFQVANCGPADYNYDETISTLRYANRAKNIKNKAKINEDPKDALLRQFQKEIEELKKRLEQGREILFQTYILEAHILDSKSFLKHLFILNTTYWLINILSDKRKMTSHY